MYRVGDVVQFIEGHKWCGCLGIIAEVRNVDSRRYMIGVPIPDSGTAYIYDDGSSIERIGEAVLIFGEDRGM